MSLINNYLKKTRLEADGTVPDSDVPPLLKSSRKKTGANPGLRAAGILLLGIIAAGGAFAYFQTGFLEKNSQVIASAPADTKDPDSVPGSAVTSSQELPEQDITADSKPVSDMDERSFKTADASGQAQTTKAVTDNDGSAATVSQPVPVSEQLKEIPQKQAVPLQTAQKAPVLQQTESARKSEIAELQNHKPVQPEIPAPQAKLEEVEQEVKVAALSKQDSSVPEQKNQEVQERSSAGMAPEKQTVSEPVVIREPREPRKSEAEPAGTAAADHKDTPRGSPSIAEPRIQPGTRQVRVEDNIKDKPDNTSISNVDVVRLPQSEINNYFQIALVAQQEKDYSHAEKFYNRVLKLNPDHLKAMTNLSVIYMQLGEESRAREMIDRILRQDPQNAAAYVNLGIMDISRNDLQGAEKNFSRALEIKPRQPTALRNLAYLAQQKGDFAAVENYYQRILNLDPDNLNILLAYAGAMEHKNDLEKAMDLYVRARKIAEENKNHDMTRQIRERISMINYYMN